MPYFEVQTCGYLLFLKRYGLFLIAALLLIAAIAVLYPYCHYYIDPDSTAYLTIARRYATSDWQQAINGYWSPWGIWMTALLAKTGWSIEFSAVIQNAAAAIGFLGISFSLFRRLALSKKTQVFLSGALVIFLSYAAYWQLFDDLWFGFFLLASLRILLAENFRNHSALWVLHGGLSALAYFAKAYALPYFFLNTVVCGFFLFRENKSAGLRMLAVSTTTLLILCAPWWYLLHDKYGFWTTGTAGGLNLSWSLAGHPFYADGITHLLPPAYPDAPSHWEDPFFSNGKTVHALDSPKLFLQQIVRSIYFTFRLLGNLSSLSPLVAGGVLAGMALLLFRSARRAVPKPIFLVALQFLMFPLGFLLMHNESRYLWYLIPVTLLLAGWATERLAVAYPLGLKLILLTGITFSFWALPVMVLKEIAGIGNAEFAEAQRLKQLGIKGSFASNADSEEALQDMQRLAYFSGMPYYLPTGTSPSKTEWLAELRRYHVRYVFYQVAASKKEDIQLTDERGMPFEEVAKGQFTNLKIYQITP